MNWLQKLMTPRIRTQNTGKGKVPEGLWEKCDGCGAVLYGPELENNLMVCPKCAHHHGIKARKRLTALFDPGSPVEMFGDLEPVDALKFKDTKKYKDRIVASQKATGERDAMIAMRGKLKGHPLAACAFEFSFMGGSMGSVVGEKFTRTPNFLGRGACPVCFSATGAPHAEGLSRDAYGQTLGLAGALRAASLPFISGSRHPDPRRCTAILRCSRHHHRRTEGADRFRRPRVIEQTVAGLPKFSSSEFLPTKRDRPHRRPSRNARQTRRPFRVMRRQPKAS